MMKKITTNCNETKKRTQMSVAIYKARAKGNRKIMDDDFMVVVLVIIIDQCNRPRIRRNPGNVYKSYIIAILVAVTS